MEHTSPHRAPVIRCSSIFPLFFFTPRFPLYPIPKTTAMRSTSGGWSVPASPHAPEVWPPYPPAAETELERALRLEEERKAKEVSDAIDCDRAGETRVTSTTPASNQGSAFRYGSNGDPVTMDNSNAFLLLPHAVRTSRVWEVYDYEELPTAIRP